MQSLSNAISIMYETRGSHERACECVWTILITAFPKLYEVLSESGFAENKAKDWVCSRHFDNETKSAAELFEEGRGEEVITRLRQVAHGIY